MKPSLQLAYLIVWLTPWLKSLHFYLLTITKKLLLYIVGDWAVTDVEE